MIFLKLFFTFFKIGLFGFGGGYGMLSLIQSETVTHNAWMTSAEFANIVAISQMTPGPIGINAATYCGYTAVHNAAMGETMAILGSATATLALVLPSFILMIMISRLFMKYMNSMVVQSIMSGLRPAVVGLIAPPPFMLIKTEKLTAPKKNPRFFGISIFILADTHIGTMALKINPIRMICWAAFAGLMLLY